LKKKHHYIIFNLSKDLTEIEVEKTGEKSETETGEQAYEAFLNILPENECRWAIYDFEFEKMEGGRRNKIIFVSW
jgi:cofilin